MVSVQYRYDFSRLDFVNIIIRDDMKDNFL